MSDVINAIPEIIEKSGSLFGIIALVAIIAALIVFFLFKDEVSKQKEKIFVYLILFFLALIFSALGVGIFSGFERGSEVAITQVEEDQSVIQLSPNTVQTLEEFIVSQGLSVTEESKVQVLEQALSAYVSATSAPETIISQPSSISSSSPTISTASDSTQLNSEDFTFNLQGCVRSGQTVTCGFLITNDIEDRELYLYGISGSRSSRSIDPNGIQYTAENIEFANDQNSTQVRVNLVQNIPVRSELTFKGIPSEVNQFSLLELSAWADEPNYFTLQFRNVAISN